MKIWILRPVDGLPNDDNPWSSWYDKKFGFVIRAESEGEARQFAHDAAGEENTSKVLYKDGKAIKIRERMPWKEKKYSTCVELTAEGESGIIIEDFASA